MDGVSEAPAEKEVEAEEVLEGQNTDHVEDDTSLENESVEKWL